METITKDEILGICGKTDHTNLNKTATAEDIVTLCEEAKRVNSASVCVAPSFVSLAKELLKGSKVKVCTVIGFPNGYQTTTTKISETIDAIKNGADELDMVLNVCQLKMKRYNEVAEEIMCLADICHKDSKVLKVIIETSLLDKKEIKEMCELCLIGGADFIKTSTGFDKSGAKIEDVTLMKESINGRGLRIKASGGIHSVEEAQKMIEAGADRIGASAVVRDALKKLEK